AAVHREDGTDGRVLAGPVLGVADVVLATPGLHLRDAPAVGQSGFALLQLQLKGSTKVIAGRLLDLRADFRTLMQLVVREAPQRRGHPQDTIGQGYEADVAEDGGHILVFFADALDQGHPCIELRELVQIDDVVAWRGVCTRGRRTPCPWWLRGIAWRRG